MTRTATSAAITLALALSATATACGGSGAEKQVDTGPVTITVNNMPPSTAPVERKHFLDDVAEFETKNPKIKLVPKEGKMDPQTFSAKLAGGQLENVFYVYFTDPAGLIARHQVAPISPYLSGFPQVKQIKPDLLKVFSDPKGKLYGLPEGNYSMGLVYNRALFTKAGLDPDSPPTTWEQLREDAKKISALGDGVVGYGDYSKAGTGGWHFAAELNARGGDVARKGTSGRWTAAFDNPTGLQVLQQLHDMRWTDGSMGQRQLLEWADLLQMMGAGKLGMYLATADNIPTITEQYKGDAKDYGLAPVPAATAALGGGAGYMFNPKDTPAQIKAGLAWLTFKYTNPDRIAVNIERTATDKQPVGLPEPNIWTGTAGQTFAKLQAEHANVPIGNYTPFVNAAPKIPVKLEPPNAQKIYAVLDTVMAKVLTDRNADMAGLLGSAEKQVNTILSAVIQ